jgi:hypothetical protein
MALTRWVLSQTCCGTLSGKAPNLVLGANARPRIEAAAQGTDDGRSVGHAVDPNPVRDATAAGCARQATLRPATIRNAAIPTCDRI